MNTIRVSTHNGNFDNLKVDEGGVLYNAKNQVVGRFDPKDGSVEFADNKAGKDEMHFLGIHSPLKSSDGYYDTKVSDGIAISHPNAPMRNITVTSNTGEQGHFKVDDGGMVWNGKGQEVGRLSPDGRSIDFCKSKAGREAMKDLDIDYHSGVLDEIFRGKPDNGYYHPDEDSGVTISYEPQQPQFGYDPSRPFAPLGKKSEQIGVPPIHTPGFPSDGGNRIGVPPIHTPGAPSNEFNRSANEGGSRAILQKATALDTAATPSGVTPTDQSGAARPGGQARFDSEEYAMEVAWDGRSANMLNKQTGVEYTFSVDHPYGRAIPHNPQSGNTSSGTTPPIHTMEASTRYIPPADTDAPRGVTPTDQSGAARPGGQARFDSEEYAMEVAWDGRSANMLNKQTGVEYSFSVEHPYGRVIPHDPPSGNPGSGTNPPIHTMGESTAPVNTVVTKNDGEKARMETKKYTVDVAKDGHSIVVTNKETGKKQSFNGDPHAYDADGTRIDFKNDLSITLDDGKTILNIETSDANGNRRKKGDTGVTYCNKVSVGNAEEGYDSVENIAGRNLLKAKDLPFGMTVPDTAFNGSKIEISKKGDFVDVTGVMLTQAYMNKLDADREREKDLNTI